MTKMDNMTASRDFGSKKLANIFKSLEQNRENTKDFVTKELENFNKQNGTNYTPLDLLAVVIDGNNYMQMTESRGQRKKTTDTEDKVDTTRFFVTIGEMDGANEKEIEKYVISKANITKEDIVDIKVLDKFSFVEVKKQFEQNILSLKDMRFNGRKINVEVAGEKAKSDKSGKGKRNSNSSNKSKGNFKGKSSSSPKGKVNNNKKFNNSNGRTKNKK